MLVIDAQMHEPSVSGDWTHADTDTRDRVLSEALFDYMDAVGVDGVLLHATEHAEWALKVAAAHPMRVAVEEGTGGLKPYVLVRGRLEALVTRALFYDLTALGVVEGEWFGVWSGGQFWPMQRAAEIGIVAQ